MTEHPPRPANPFADDSIEAEPVAGNIFAPSSGGYKPVYETTQRPKSKRIRFCAVFAICCAVAAEISFQFYHLTIFTVAFAVLAIFLSIVTLAFCSSESHAVRVGVVPKGEGEATRALGTLVGILTIMAVVGRYVYLLWDGFRGG